MSEYQRLYRESLEDPDGFWRRQSELLTWFHPPQNILDVDMEEADFSWFGGGMLNACFNAVDRHLGPRGDKPAIIWARDEPGDYQSITYRELKHQVARLANVLLAHGVRRGDRVGIYLPMIPQAAYSMLACARIGAVHTVVFAGFSADALRDRIVDAGCKVLITANEGLRGGRTTGLKATVDQAIADLSSVETVLVARRTEGDVNMVAGRDYWLDEEMDRERSTCPAEWMHSESPLFILYPSGSTGRPKGVLHTTAGYLLYTALTHRQVFDLREDDVYLCAADVGWITGHSYVVYGPLVNGATTVMFESTPVHPDASRYWRIVDDLKVSVFYTAPTAIRSIARAGDKWVERYDRSSLRVLGSGGEPISEEVWHWYRDVVGEGRCSVVDTWWQTEAGGILISPLADLTPTKPGSATLPFFGVEPVIVDDEGRQLEGGEAQGNLCINRPWPGQARTIWGDHSRYRRTYFSRFPGLYFTGDGCRRDEDGYFWMTGRVDDVLNVSAHRLSTGEIEGALAVHDAVAESAVVGFPHEVKGTGICAFVRLAADHEGQDPEKVVGLLKEQVRHVIGPIATPDRIEICHRLPKTRAGKIQRTILSRIALGEFEDLGDISGLEDPMVVERLVEDVKRQRDQAAQ
jgi:acetyl-CoA synthetase